MTDGLCPFAVHRLLPETDGDGRGDQPRIDPRVAILHSAAGRGSLYGWFAGSSNLESQFWVSEQGVIEQYGLTTLRADANLKANGFAVSIETESSPTATERWTPKQAAAIVRLLDWLCTVHPKIKRQQCPTWDGSGIGWHIMFGTPGPWTPVAKSCPGPARVEQARNEIIPAVIAAGHPQPEDDMPYSEADLKRIVAAAVKPIADDLAKVKTEVTGLKADYLTKGKGVRQSIAVIEDRTEDLVTGKRPGKG